MGGIEFLKGHGTQNDFVLLPDAPGRLDLTPERVAALCDRQRGLGADGVLRVVRSSAIGLGSEAEWFMDYRNADGSAAEMCGNGMRVFARYLVEAGLESGRDFAVGTRAGDRPVRVHGDNTVTVHMGPARITGTSVAVVGERELSGVAVDVGNPHLVSTLDDDVAELDLREAPRFDRDFFPNGVNLEFVNVLAADALRMRVYERGVGETRACGTGTVAVVAAALHLAGTDTGSSTVDIPGGRVAVTVERGASTLTGPAEFVARGELDESWWNGLGR
ncbi:diaminopimelate epimerase [Prauserella marina]|uniref:Diaminopimelate epimerase n=1 Tax=Prauserella marina TaxID=530584 RepID=A0A1G6UV97_9PSEU|nr:diaminopimelate epimerase [Prauserella marina]PWV74617.1 diaminopimelate epimerase [Prauserella marina]SDD45201.1 diaminopimelate epimerase [Prauserella marina]